MPARVQGCAQPPKPAFQKAGICLSMLFWIFCSSQHFALRYSLQSVFHRLSTKKIYKGELLQHPWSACSLRASHRHIGFLVFCQYLHPNSRLKWSEDIDSGTSLSVQYTFHISTVIQTTHSSPLPSPTAALPLEGLSSQKTINWITQMGKTEGKPLTQGLVVIWAWSLLSLINAN